MSELEEIKIKLAKLEDYNIRNDEYHVEEREKTKDMAQKIDDMHAVFTATGLVGKSIKWIAGFIIAVGSAYLLVKELFFHN